MALTGVGLVLLCLIAAACEARRMRGGAHGAAGWFLFHLTGAAVGALVAMRGLLR